MSKRTNHISYKNNYKFIDSSLINDDTFEDYLRRLRKVALSIFEWVNLPLSMDSRFIEKSLYYNGQCAFLFHEKYGHINSNCASTGKLNIYGLPTELTCFTLEDSKNRLLYQGLPHYKVDKKTKEVIEIDPNINEQCILVMNDWERTPTQSTLELFALRLYEAERSSDVNIKNQKFPLIIGVEDSQRAFLENLYSQIDGNMPVIMGDKKQLGNLLLNVVETNSPFVADKLQDYKKEIWNEALTSLGINNIMVDKKERLITEEANGNNELINLILQSYLAPRQKACELYNKLYKLKTWEISKEEYYKNIENEDIKDKFYKKQDRYYKTDKISVRVRSDLKNIIKQMQSTVSSYNDIEELDNNTQNKEGANE